VLHIGRKGCGWDFFYHLDRNYKSWHPEEHIVFKWTGEPMKIGSKYYAEEYLKRIIENKSP